MFFSPLLVQVLQALTQPVAERLKEHNTINEITSKCARQGVADMLSCEGWARDGKM